MKNLDELPSWEEMRKLRDDCAHRLEERNRRLLEGRDRAFRLIEQWEKERGVKK